ncbi:MAG: hypothetical protein EBR55_09305, partial [Chitinophagia bacterium]|nr:hypothetical protein [Chitinophagia bacterium]
MNFTTAAIENIVHNYYELTVEAKALDGYDELNFILTEKFGKKYILKIAGEQHDKDFIDAQIKIIGHLRTSPIADQVQYYIKNKKDSELISTCDICGYKGKGNFKICNDCKE